MEKIYLRQPVIVEGRYDKIKLQSLIGSLIIPTDGFRIFKDREKQAMIRTLGEQYGLVILTDSDRAGLVIRSHLKSIAGKSKIVQLYIPQIIGKEARKKTPGKEHLLGVEGMELSLLRRLFAENGLLEDAKARESASDPITKQDFYADGFSGGENSAKKRGELIKRLRLPPYLSANALLEVCSRMLTKEEYRALVRKINEENDRE